MNARLMASLAAGALFGAGLALSGMTDPARVLGFLDVAGAFDPTLAFVLGGAVAVAVPGFRLVLRRPKPLLAERFQLPEKRSIDLSLVVGAAIFGIGWGLAGYCPGPAWVALAAGAKGAWVFILAMLAGSLLQRFASRVRAG